MATATEGYVDSQTARMKAETHADLIEALRESDRLRFRETMWLAALILAGIGVATGLIIAVLG